MSLLDRKAVHPRCSWGGPEGCCTQDGDRYLEGRWLCETHLMEFAQHRLQQRRLRVGYTARKRANLKGDAA